MPSPAAVPTFQAFDDARAHCIVWLGTYKNRSPYRWEWDTTATLFCEPVPGFPCYVMPMVTGNPDRGFTARLAFSAGVKYEGRYWQGRVPGPDEAPILSESALDTLDSILGVLDVASRISIGDPDSNS